MGAPCVARFLQLLQTRGFVQEISVSVNGMQRKLFQFGAQGTLLRRNIVKQWWDATVLEQPNTFCVECPSLMVEMGLGKVNSVSAVREKHSHSSVNGSGVGFQNGNNSAVNEDQKTLPFGTVFRSSLTADCASAYLSCLELSNRQLPVSVSSVGQCFVFHEATSCSLSTRQSEDHSTLPQTEENHKSEDDQNRLLKQGVCETHFLLQHYTPPVNVAQTFDLLLRTRLRWWKQYATNPSKLHTSSVTNEESNTPKTVITYDFPWGTEVVESITNHGDTPLQRMEVETGVKHQGLYHQKPFLPHLIECQTTVESCMSVFLTDAFRERQVTKRSSASKASPAKRTSNPKVQAEKDDQVNDVRLVLQLHPQLCPYQVSLSVTGSKSRQVRVLAEHIAKELREVGIFVLNSPGNSELLDSQYRRNDELGIPYTVVLSDQTLDKGVLNIRHRDTGLKQQQHVSTLQAVLLKNLHAVDQD